MCRLTKMNMAENIIYRRDADKKQNLSMGYPSDRVYAGKMRKDRLPE